MSAAVRISDAALTMQGRRDFVRLLALLTFPKAEWASAITGPSSRTIRAGPSDYRRALAGLTSGETLNLAPGNYDRGLPVHQLIGEASHPIVIEGPRPPARAFWGACRIYGSGWCATVSSRRRWDRCYWAEPRLSSAIGSANRRSKSAAEPNRKSAPTTTSPTAWLRAAATRLGAFDGFGSLSGGACGLRQASGPLPPRSGARRRVHRPVG